MSPLSEAAPGTAVAFEDGTLLVSADSPRTFLVEDGHRRPIPDEATLIAHRLHARPRISLPDPDIDSLPMGSALAAQPQATVRAKTDLGGGHYMDSSAVLSPSGELSVTTRTWNITWLSGFHGGVIVTLQDENDVVIASTGQQVYGVDGTIIGRSDYTATWTALFPPDVIARTRSIVVLHAWVPRVDLIGAVRLFVELVKAVRDLIDALKNKGSAGGAQGPKLPGPMIPPVIV
jgi:hypothetical protein